VFAIWNTPLLNQRIVLKYVNSLVSKALLLAYVSIVELFSRRDWAGEVSILGVGSEGWCRVRSEVEFRDTAVKLFGKYLCILLSRGRI
jgi:hypothetical protein